MVCVLSLRVNYCLISDLSIFRGGRGVKPGVVAGPGIDKASVYQLVIMALPRGLEPLFPP